MTIADPRGPMGITGYLENIRAMEI